MPSQQEIEGLFVTRGSDHLIYRSSEGKGPVYLVSSGDGLHTVSLKSGQYGFGSDETGSGDAIITLKGGGIHDAKVVSTVPETLPDGSTDAINLVLKLKLA
ncbi:MULTISPECIES: hypothetical protein [unclassified Pseudomonas]|uniref:hypothetical protein n=1 Tax=unclassified Pseudomonas TaxID=196821 RepID=UPI0024097973|nr:hypothetical protein [Pseudomonas sp. NyZ480]WEZ90410.1 hypothetical protein P3R38_09155 [Pseudomonas sp. NyZ480]